jgi:hypothetical protein
MRERETADRRARDGRVGGPRRGDRALCEERSGARQHRARRSLIYRWAGRIADDAEWLLVINTERAASRRSARKVTARYTVPEVIAVEIFRLGPISTGCSAPALQTAAAEGGSRPTGATYEAIWDACSYRLSYLAPVGREVGSDPIA